MAIDLNGSTQFLRNYTWTPPTTGVLTIGARVWADTRPQFANIMSNWGNTVGGQFLFSIHDVQGDLSLYVTQSNGSAAGPAREGAGSPLATGQWHSVVGLADGSNIKVFRAGVQVGSPVSYNGTLKSSLVGLGVGARLNDAATAAVDAFWDGRRADVFVANVAWTAEEIAAYSQGFSPLLIRRGLINHWRIVRPGATEPDAVGSSALTVEGAPSVVEHPPVITGRQAAVG